MDYGPLQRFEGSMQYMAGRADLWSYNYTGVNSLGHIYPQSGYNWADGIFMSDWNGFTGSESYRLGLKKGLTDLGGKLYGFDKLGRVDRNMEYEGFGGRLWRWNPYGGEANVTLGRWLAAGGDYKLVVEAAKKGEGYTLYLGAWELMAEYDLWQDGGNGQGNPILLNEVTKFGYFGIKHLANTVWIVDSEEVYTGFRTDSKGRVRFVYAITTGGLKGKPARVYVHSRVLKDSNLLYITVGHELIHVDHRLSGLYELWQIQQSLKYAHYASEYLAWKWVASLGERASMLHPEERMKEFYHLLPLSFRQTLDDLD